MEKIKMQSKVNYIKNLNRALLVVSSMHDDIPEDEKLCKNLTNSIALMLIKGYSKDEINRIVGISLIRLIEDNIMEFGKGNKPSRNVSVEM